MEPFCSQAVVPVPAPATSPSPLCGTAVLLSRVLTVCSPGAAGTVAPGVLSNARSSGDSVVLSPSPPFAAGLRAAGDAKQESWESGPSKWRWGFIFRIFFTITCDRPVVDHGSQVSPPARFISVQTHSFSSPTLSDISSKGDIDRPRDLSRN